MGKNTILLFLDRDNYKYTFKTAKFIHIILYYSLIQLLYSLMTNFFISQSITIY